MRAQSETTNPRPLARLCGLNPAESSFPSRLNESLAAVPAQRPYAGTSFHRPARVGDDIRIAGKRVDLVNCNAPLEGLLVPFRTDGGSPKSMFFAVWLRACPHARAALIGENGRLDVAAQPGVAWDA